MSPVLFASGIGLSLFAGLVFFVATAPAFAKKLPAHPINLNTATLEQLEEMPGVGSVMAHAILKFREDSGPFERVDDLLALRGISQRRLDKIRPFVYVGKGKKSARSSQLRHKQEKNSPRGGS